MSQEDNQPGGASLGAFLREQREKKGAALTEVTEATKISAKILQAIEEDDYATLPAEAFSRAFYSMYAEFLDLDPAEIVARYQESCGIKPDVNKPQATPPGKKSKTFSSYAEPTALSPLTMLTIIIAATLLIGVLACWYLDWNPATALNTKLRSLKSTTLPQQEDILPPTLVPTDPAPTQHETPATAPTATPAAEPQAVPAPLPAEASSPSEPSAAQPATAPAPEAEKVAPAGEQTQTTTPQENTYLLEATFRQDGQLQITLDDGFVIEKTFQAGEALQWQAVKKMVLVLPAELEGSLRLNGIELPLPPAEGGRRLLSLPEDLLN